MQKRATAIWNDIVQVNRIVSDVPRYVPKAPQRHAIVLAGGSGRRLAELTHKLTGKPTPKQYCSFDPDGATLLQKAVHRASHVVDGSTIVVVRDAHRDLAEEQVANTLRCHIISQPCDCGTALGLLVGLLEVATRDPSGQIIVLPADHGFGDERVLHQVVNDAFRMTQIHPERVVLVAAEADRAATDYGWLVPKEITGDRLCHVDRFVEKPDASKAERLLQNGAAWSTMIVVASAYSLVHLFARHHPTLVRMFVNQCMRPPEDRDVLLRRAFATLRPVDFSRDVLERDDHLWMLTLPRAAGWSDLGTEERLRAWQTQCCPGPCKACGDGHRTERQREARAG